MSEAKLEQDNEFDMPSSQDVEISQDISKNIDKKEAKLMMFIVIQKLRIQLSMSLQQISNQILVQMTFKRFNLKQRRMMVLSRKVNLFKIDQNL